MSMCAQDALEFLTIIHKIVFLWSHLFSSFIYLLTNITRTKYVIGSFEIYSVYILALCVGTQSLVIIIYADLTKSDPLCIVLGDAIFSDDATHFLFFSVSFELICAAALIFHCWF